MPHLPPVHEPHKIKTVRPIAFPTLEERKRNLSAAHFNVFNLTPSPGHLRHGLLRHQRDDPGAARRPARRRRGLRRGAQLRDARRGRHARPRPHLRLPDPQQRSARSSSCVATLGAAGLARCPSNARGRVDLHAPRGIEIRDVRDHAESVFTGNFDLARLEALIAERAAAFIGCQAFADGQHPFSLANLRAVRATRRPARACAWCSTSRA